MARRQVESKWGFRVAITPSPSKIAKLFGDSGKEFANFKPAFQSLAPKMVEGIRRIYASKGAVIGEPWPGLKNKYYLAKKARKGWSTAEMYASGVLASSIRPLSITRRSLKVGVRDVPYAKAMQWGRRSNNIAVRKGGARVFVALDDTAKAQAREELSAHLNALMAMLAKRISEAV